MNVKMHKTYMSYKQLQSRCHFFFFPFNHDWRQLLIFQPTYKNKNVQREPTIDGINKDLHLWNCLLRYTLYNSAKKNYWLELAVAESVTVWNLIWVWPFFWRCIQADYGFNTQPEMEYREADSEFMKYYIIIWKLVGIVHQKPKNPVNKFAESMNTRWTLFWERDVWN